MTADPTVVRRTAWPSEREPRLLGPLGRRVALGSVAIALVSIALLATVTLLVLDSDLGSTGREQEGAYTSAIVSSVRSAYLAADGWPGADLTPAAALANQQGVGVEIRTSSGSRVEVAPSSSSGTTLSKPIAVDGRQVGVVVLTQPSSGLSPAEATLRRNLVNGVALAASLAALLALVAAVVASRRLVAPLERLTAAVARFGSGDRSARVGAVRAPGEIGQLAATFDAMATDLEREDELRRALVADVAHELRTPVTILRAQLAAVSEGITDLSSATVDSLGEEVDRLARLVEDLGVLAATEAASLEVVRAPVDVSDVAAIAADRLAPRLADRHVSLELDLAPAVVLGDAGRLEQAVVNLLSNAVKFSSPESEVHLGVTAEDGEVVVSVTDSGPGIPRAEQSRVFERFYRGETTRTTTPGSGVGLAVVAEIARAHGGVAELESEPGHGSTFRLRLPSPP